ncbi:DNA (cytosine-5-)-methyltransferase [Candidatus Geothermarchaeota archaeon ex4572_27]|nr:MAG: DNA (cytosine-5-)-methyltransferase [Candidatus Geothermarchaeota archaeon ex4572_27]
MTYTLIDLFSGAGGFSLGFKRAGFRILVAIDNAPPVAKTYRYNFPEVNFIERDIQEVEGWELIEAAGGSPPDVVIASPPCEPFTAANARRMRDPLDRLYTDPIGRLTLHAIRLIGDLSPKVFVIENVPQIMDGPLKGCIRDELRRAGYSEVHFNVLRAEDYGSPSRRTRVFISNVKIKPRPVERRVRVIDAIGDLPEPNGDIPNHEYVPMSPRKLRKAARLRWGSSLVKYAGSSRKLYTNWVRLHPYRPSPPVLGNSRFIHPFEARLLTVREHARLMGFPDDHVFLGGRDSQFDMVGEAVPVPLSYAIAVEVAKHLSTRNA